LGTTHLDFSGKNLTVYEGLLAASSGIDRALEYCIDRNGKLNRSHDGVMSRTTVLLLFVCLLAAIPMFFFGATYYIDYDGYWHVFIARLDWRNMLVDSKATAHPPLFFSSSRL